MTNTTITGRRPSDPEPGYLRPHQQRIADSLLDVDFGYVERRVAAAMGLPRHMLGLEPYGGLKIVVVHPPAPRKRSWEARLFSRPWRPWQKTEPGPEHPLWGLVQGDDGYRVGNTLYVSPAGYATLAVAAKLAPLQE